MTNRILEVRTEKNTSQSQLAEAIGVSRQAISLYEKGEREPKLDTWVKLADYFGVSVGYLQGITPVKGSYDRQGEAFIDELINKGVSRNFLGYDDEEKYYSDPDFRFNQNDLSGRNDVLVNQYYVLNNIFMPGDKDGKTKINDRKIIVKLMEIIQSIYDNATRINIKDATHNELNNYLNELEYLQGLHIEKLTNEQRVLVEKLIDELGNTHVKEPEPFNPDDLPEDPFGLDDNEK